ncbi:hypothetical protein M1N04_00935 [Peptococcaceae bacterium]|nr:hypothetical protein [Peptococcaceae bacterium]
MFNYLKEVAVYATVYAAVYARYGVKDLLKSEEGTLKDFAYLIGGFIITVLIIGAGYAAIEKWTPEFLANIKRELDEIFGFKELPIPKEEN